MVCAAAGARLDRSLIHLSIAPTMSAAYLGFQIALPRLFSAAIIAGMIVFPFGLGYMVRRFKPGDVEELNAVCIVVCVISIVLGDFVRWLPQRMKSLGGMIAMLVPD